MKAFEFDHNLIDAYARFSRSFSTVRADDIAGEIKRQYDEGRFWPDALLSLNPRFLSGPTVDDLVVSGDLDEATAKIFRIGTTPIKFHRHQAQSIAKARAGQSYVVTTGTGSGKSLCFFVPVVDAIVRARKAGRPRKTSAIIVYPMNALANSQIKEIDKFISQSGLPEDLKPVVRRYTGQESQEERQRIADNPPDILLTNFMMAELLLTRQDALDTKVIDNASGLEFIVLDELHTYRGRQGADVAILVRRLRNRCAPNKAPICIGTSATMASEGSEGGRAKAVADVSSRLFGASIGPDAVIDESLQRATDDRLKLEDVRPQIASALGNELPEVLTDEVLRRHPLAVWAELAIGLDDGQELKRKKPVPFDDAVKQLSLDSGLDKETCRTGFERFLTRVSLPESERGGGGSGAFLAFKLHRFISGAGEIFTTLTGRPRRVLFEGQLEDPDAPGHRLYPTRFCRECGHEVHVVTKTEDADGLRFLPRNIDDTPIADPDGDIAGYLTPVGEGDSDYAFDGDPDSYPEDWREERNGIERLRANRKGRLPEQITVRPDGRYGPDGASFWFIPGKFGFCPCCLDQPSPGARERSKLAGLSGEGRSSATTHLVSTALEWMNGDSSGVPAEKRKLLGFTDNRQDAALQAGHFNDYLFVSLLRGAILRAVLDAGSDGMAEDEFGLRVVKALGFTASNKDSRIHWMLDPEAGAVVREDAQRSLAKVLAHRVWTDLRRGWRYTNPSLSVLKLVDVEFIGLDDIAEDREALMAVHPALGDLDADACKKLLKDILGAMLEGLAVSTEALDLTVLDTVGQKSRNLLRTPWAIDQKETPRSRSTLFLQAPGKDRVGLREEQTIIRAGHNSRIGRSINRKSVIGTKLNKTDYLAVMTGLLELMTREGLVSLVEIEADLLGWRLSPSAVRLVPGEAIRAGEAQGNRYFHDLYNAIATDLKKGRSTYWGLEGREHTAQVSQRQREWREWRFRFEDDDRAKLKENAAEIKSSGESDQFLPALFCSPTMELGVDISALNAVYLRNVPPTPANYAQRAGRAGRSGQAAVIVTYCAAQSPHDQYFFERRNDMVAGVVRPPALDITNEELVRSHLHAVWLAEAKLALSPDIPEILDLKQAKYPLKQEVIDVVNRPSLVTAARAPMKRVLDQILASMDGKKPVWMGDEDDFILQVALRAPQEFDRAFDRWRELYNSARTQLVEANSRSEITGLSGADRRKIKAAQMQASDQIAILEQGKATNGSDFYSYRYLATEGFLPGYNFPRLPLYAFVPGEGKAGSFLQRARFLAISEFGPRSLIYHEGRAYRVMKAKLPPEVRTGDGSELATKDIFICSNCGACHEGEVERCHACNSPMAGEVPVQRTLRIDNVEAAPADRITANDEERVRQGFDIQTVFSWPKKDGHLQVTEADFRCGDTSILALQYANSAEISRINKGLKRRKNQTVFGFNIDPRSGYWAKSEDEDPDVDVPPDVARPVRIVPIVRDRKNALLLRFREPDAYAPETIATVQHALLRGIAVTYQLEEGEILGEPLPARDNRRSILAYEATEGGAGVLNRLVEDAHALGKVVREALSIMHFDNVDKAIAAGDAKLLVDRDGDACVRGCYRCLLSYFNQPDHELIDRASIEAKQMLIDLARGEVILANGSPRSTGAVGWEPAFKDASIPAPDSATVSFADQEMSFVWRNHFVAACTETISEAARLVADAKGWTLFELPETCAAGVPDALISMFKIDLMTVNFAPGDLVFARGREWVALPSPREGILALRPLSGSENDTVILDPSLETQPVAAARFDLPSDAAPTVQSKAALLADAMRLTLRRGAGPFRSAAQLAFEPRTYQLVPLLMALRLQVPRLLIADDVGIGKTIEAGLILRELMDRREVDGFSVLCPPHLVEQWVGELKQRFGIEAVAVTSGSAARLERGLPLAQTLFDAYPYTVVSLDYIKAEKRREGFARACPDFVIVDEAHACVGTHKGKQQRFELLAGLARDPERRMIFLTATPHSGDEDAFGRLLSLIEPSFGAMNFEDARYRERLARHFVQRQRIDLVSGEWDENRAFPKHETTESPYRLSQAHLDFQEAVLDYCFGVVSRAGTGLRERRLAFWGTLALMRCVGSSPAAALSALRNRMSNESDRLEPQIYDEDSDDEDAVDIEPSIGFDTDPALLALVVRAEELVHKGDPKLTALVDALTPLIKKGVNPVVFCRYLATAEHVRNGLRKAFPKLAVEAVTGVLTPDERRDRVAEMASADDQKEIQRILVATDCLSEGINLQQLFDTVIHYDLSWNPTRHQQREGRVDRFGQPAELVRSIMMFSPDSAIDGAVLEVILRKAEEIRKATGVTVPLPDNRGPVTDALMASMMLRRGGTRQLALDLRLDDGTKAMEVRWRDASESEKKSRARFAQNAMKPQEVAPEWEKVRTLLGSPADARVFIERAMSRFGVPLEPRKTLLVAHVHALEAGLKERLTQRGLSGSVRLAMVEPAPSGTSLLTRTHPLTATLAEALVEASLDPEALSGLGIGRVGAWPTSAVQQMTRVALLRIRFKLTVHARKERLLLAEEAALVALQGGKIAASGEAARALLNTPATSDLASSARDRFIGKSKEDLPSLLDGPLADFVKTRAEELMQDHARLRAAAGSASRVTVEAVLPPDVIGLFVLMPSEV